MKYLALYVLVVPHHHYLNRNQNHQAHAIKKRQTVQKRNFFFHKILFTATFDCIGSVGFVIDCVVDDGSSFELFAIVGFL